MTRDFWKIQAAFSNLLALGLALKLLPILPPFYFAPPCSTDTSTDVLSNLLIPIAH